MTSILIAIIILWSCFRKPMLGFALLLQINIIRAVMGINYENPCFVCVNEPDIILGALTPILAYLVIVARLQLKGNVKYVLDGFDIFFFFTTAVLFFTSIYSPNIKDSLGYSFKFLLLGSSFYFFSKIALINTLNYQDAVKDFLKFSYRIAVFFGLFGGLLYLTKGQDAYRLTLPGVHAIPFSQLIGLGVVISFVIFISNGTFLNNKSKLYTNINKILLPILVLALFATNTRGVMLSAALAIFFYLLIAKVKIKKRTLYISGTLMLIALIVVINYIDFEVLFSRILTKHTNKSVDDRLIAYTDSITLFFQYPFGIGPNSFKYFSILPYPHNFYLENMAQYGIFGLAMNIYISVLGLFILIIAYNNRYKDIMFVFIGALFIYFFVETMFSFTLWMHKGLYITMGIFAAYFYNNKKQSSLLKNQ